MSLANPFPWTRATAAGLADHIWTCDEIADLLDQCRRRSSLTNMESCFACDVNAGRVLPPGGTIYADDFWIADHGIPAILRGYVVLKPRRHVRDLADLDASEAGTLGVVAQRLLAAMRMTLGPERIYVCSFGESLHHLHFHLLPRYGGMPPTGAAFVEAAFGQKWLASEDEAAEAAHGIRVALASG